MLINKRLQKSFAHCLYFKTIIYDHIQRAAKIIFAQILDARERVMRNAVDVVITYALLLR